MRKMILLSVAVFIAMVASACSSAGNFKIQKSFDAGSIKEVVINNESWDIELKSTNSNQITIAAEGKHKDKQSEPVTINNDGSTIQISQHKQDRSFMDNITIGREGTITISIPVDGVEAITVNNRFGEMNVTDIATKRMVILTESGAATITGLTAEIGKFTSEHGELSLKRSAVKELTAVSTTGDNYMTDVSSSAMNITSINGEISIQDANEGESLVAKTESGDISVSYKEAPTSLLLNANSRSDITVHLSGFNETNNSEQARAGRIGAASNTLELVSGNGAIHIK